MGCGAYEMYESGNLRMHIRVQCESWYSINAAIPEQITIVNQIDNFGVAGNTNYVVRFKNNNSQYRYVDLIADGDIDPDVDRLSDRLFIAPMLFEIQFYPDQDSTEESLRVGDTIVSTIQQPEKK